MKKFIAVGVIASATCLGIVGVTDCTPANTPTWWQNFLQDPVEQTQSFEEGVNVVLQGVQVAWAVIEPLIPAAQQGPAQQAFLDAEASVTNAEQVLLDAAQAIVASQGDGGSMANIVALMADVSNAISSVIAIVDQWDGLTHPGFVPGLAQAKAEHRTLQMRFLGMDAAAPVAVPMVSAPIAPASVTPIAPAPSASVAPVSAAPPAASSAAPAPSASHAPVTHPAKH